MLPAKPAYRASVKGGGLLFCWQTLSSGLLISYPWLILQLGAFSASKVSGGGKNQQASRLARKEKSPPTPPVGSLERWPTPNAPFCKNSPLKSWKGYGRLATPQNPSQKTSLKDGWKEHLWRKQDFISWVFPKHYLPTPCKEEKGRHPQINTKAPFLTIRLQHCWHNYLLNKYKFQSHRFKIELPQQK